MSDANLRHIYTKYPVWLIYWWKFASVYRYSLREFRASIVLDEATAKKHNRIVSSEPMWSAAEMIDRYNTWSNT